MTADETTNPAFTDLGLVPPLLATLTELGYEVPSPIQARSIPILLEGRDLIGQAQTGTGKTAAFALPILQRIDVERRATQALVLTPTRELAIQVAEAFQRYGSKLNGVRAQAVYGGQAHEIQLRALRRGAHVVVGTPGRIMDHLRRGTIDFSGLSTVVLDEADDMLRMGFIEDVEWILEHTPKERQTVLFSATMPPAVARIASKHLRDAVSASIERRLTAGSGIRQRAWVVGGVHRLDALTRILEVEPVDAMIVFVRTKTATVELAERLAARGFACEAINGDMVQSARERAIDRLKNGKLDVLVATDVAARGLDVDRISHVVNFDAPSDPEVYVHRIGRTGRAGREGQAIIFISARERPLLGAIEKAIGRKLEPMKLPTTTEVNDRRVERFKTRITTALEAPDLDLYAGIVKSYAADNDVAVEDVAAALARLAQGDQPLLLAEREEVRAKKKEVDEMRFDAEAPPRHGNVIVYRVEIGKRHGVAPGDLVGAIGNETGLPNARIGKIDVRSHHSTIELPDDLPRVFFERLSRVRVKRRFLRLHAVR